MITSGQDAGYVRYLSVFFSNTFVRFAVPLFFILSGAAFFRDYDNKKYVSKLKSRFWSLLIPYLIWNTLGMLFEIATSYTFVSQYMVAREKFAVTVPNVLKAIFLYECNGPFWFICALIVFVILSPLFELLTKNKAVSFLALAALICVSQFEVPYLSVLIKGTDSAVFYLIGCIIGRHFLPQFSGKCRKSVSLCSVAVLVLCTAAWFLRGIGLFELPVPLEVVILTVYAMSFWYAMDLFDIQNARIRPFMNDNLFIYAMHVNLSAIIVKLLYLILPKNAICSIPNFFLTTFLTISIILLLAFLLRRFCNPVYCLLSGKRKRSITR